MKVDKIAIKNFRLLKDVTLTLDEKSTVIVGRNNSGKTSLTELIRRLLSEKPLFRLEDFSLCAYDEFWKAFKLQHEDADEDTVRQALPYIEAKLFISYKDNLGHLGPLSDFIIDLNPECTTAIACMRYELIDGRIKSLFSGLTFDEEEKDRFFQVMKERIPQLFKVNLSAIDPNDESNTRFLEWSRLHSLLKSGFINAQRGLDDETFRDKDVLGKILEALFIAARSESADEADKKIAKELEDAVKEIQNQIGEEFNEKLSDLVPAMSLFGYPGLRDPGLLMETTLDVQRLLTNNTKIRYSGISGVSLPEAFNGLGARNLVFILFKLFEFFKAYKSRENAPGIHLVFIEEPEAHLHPQMQEVFIRQLHNISKIFAQKFNNGVPWPVQFIVSTHSSHIANEAPFSTIRYFISSQHSPGENLFSTKIKDLNEGLGGVLEEDKQFLHQYMTLTRCDLMFADKAILIEGTSERILMPKFFEKVDTDQPEGLKLSSQYVSIMEVDGAYAHIFYPLLDFLELETLIITDIDTINSNGEADKVSLGVDTSNACIRNWFGGGAITPTQLFAKTEADKISTRRRIAYQVPEAHGNPCGRSFEDAFMLANPSLFTLDESSVDEKENDAWEKAKKKRKKKTAFALEHAIRTTNWIVPLYIREGLIWLVGKSEQETLVEEVTIAGTEPEPLNS